MDQIGEVHYLQKQIDDLRAQIRAYHDDHFGFHAVVGKKLVELAKLPTYSQAASVKLIWPELGALLDECSDPPEYRPCPKTSIHGPHDYEMRDRLDQPHQFYCRGVGR